MNIDRHEIMLGIVTPTYNRPKLLVRFISRLLKQKFSNWVVVFIHDGPSEEFQRLSERFSSDHRMIFTTTAQRHNDCGNTPRLEGLETFKRRGISPDYVVFWDDDNYFYTDALKLIVQLARRLGECSFFLVGMKYHERILPPKNTAAAGLTPGQIDTANFVIKPGLGSAAYGLVIRHPEFQSPERLLISDFLVFSAVRYELEQIPVFPDIIVGFHDGLRWAPFIRNLLGLKPLRLASKSWVRKITGGRINQRPAGGLD